MATFSNAGISGDFIHEPLQDPRREIRLVQLDLSGAEDSDIDCAISAFTIDNAPAYVAVSYTWGDITQRRSIRVNGKQLSIGYNSWQALWQIRLHRLADTVWIDVLSIGQANDVEKSLQVSLMGTIYKTARLILQEISRAKQIVFACGNSTFQWDELWNFEKDIDRPPDQDVDLQRCAKMKKRTVSWYLMHILKDTLLSVIETPEPVWELASVYNAWHCEDDRDRVFGLLSIADERSIEAIKPDYTISKTAVLLQLLAHACNPANRGELSESVQPVEAMDVIGGFGLGPDNPEIAGLLQERREKVCNPSAPPAVELQALPISSVDSRKRMPVCVHGYCTLSRNDSGHLVAALRPHSKEHDSRSYVSVNFGKERKTWSSEHGPGGAFVHAQTLASKHACLIHNQGVVVAVAHKNAKPGDILLQLGYNTDLHALLNPSAGVVVRKTAGDRYSVVGQVVYNPEVAPCKSDTDVDDAKDGNTELVGYAKCDCDGGEEHHARSNHQWTLHFALEDLLLFTTQDLDFRERPKEKDVAPIAELHVRPEETAKRLRTSVTSSPFSSYATYARTS